MQICGSHQAGPLGPLCTHGLAQRLQLGLQGSSFMSQHSHVYFGLYLGAWRDCFKICRIFHDHVQWLQLLQTTAWGEVCVVCVQS